MGSAFSQLPGAFGNVLDAFNKNKTQDPRNSGPLTYQNGQWVQPGTNTPAGSNTGNAGSPSFPSGGGYFNQAAQTISNLRNGPAGAPEPTAAAAPASHPNIIQQLASWLTGGEQGPNPLMQKQWDTQVMSPFGQPPRSLDEARARIQAMQAQRPQMPQMPQMFNPQPVPQSLPQFPGLQQPPAMAQLPQMPGAINT